MNMEPNRIPKHIAIIMDGNGRWAKQHGKERSYGHQVGTDTVYKIAEEASRLGVRYLTLYTFSTENWNRPEEEITALMDLLFISLENEEFFKNNVRFRVIGDIDKLPQRIRDRIEDSIKRTEHKTGMCLVLALSYSSRWEITEAAKKIADEVKAGTLNPGDIDEQCLASHLATNFMPYPDLLIRTGGEVRMSNYLLWQCAYSELYFCDTYWPDFNVEELHKAIEDFQQRERRFGKTSEQLNIR
jgi:undecaprenyl diphosphate synthase